MIYLIAKYALLLLLAALCGFLLGRWWVRRSFVDVTESYETMSKAASAAPWERLWQRLDQSEARTREIVGEELRALPQPKPEQVDLAPLRKGIDEFTMDIREILASRKPKAPDFSPLLGIFRRTQCNHIYRCRGYGIDVVMPGHRYLSADAFTHQNRRPVNLHTATFGRRDAAWG